MEKLPEEAVTVIRVIGSLWLIGQSKANLIETTPEEALETVNAVLEKTGAI